MEQFLWLIVIATRLHRVPRGARLRARDQPGRERPRAGGGRRHVQEPERPRAEHGRRHAARGLAGAAPDTIIRRAGAVGLRAADDRRDRRVAVAQRHDRPRRDGAGPRRAISSAPTRGSRSRPCSRSCWRCRSCRASYWHRLSSITDESQDDTGSREARRILLRESFTAFLQHPLTGVGAGQFKNYDPERPRAGLAREPQRRAAGRGGARASWARDVLLPDRARPVWRGSRRGVSCAARAPRGATAGRRRCRRRVVTDDDARVVRSGTRPR